MSNTGKSGGYDARNGGGFSGGQGGARDRAGGGQGHEGRSGGGTERQSGGGSGTQQRGGGGGSSLRPIPSGIYQPDKAPDPDKNITSLEDRLFGKSTPMSIYPTSAEPFPVRQKGKHFTTKGESIKLRTNHFAITPTPEAVTWYKYDVDALYTTSQQQARGARLRELFKHIVQLPAFAGVDWATDYSSIIVTNRELNISLPQTNTFDPPPPRRAGNAAAQRSATNTTVNQGTVNDTSVSGVTQAFQGLTFAQQVQSRNRITYRILKPRPFDLSNMTDYLSDPSLDRDFSGRIEIISLLNIITCKAPNADDQQIAKGSNQKFYPFGTHPSAETMDIEGGLIAVRGYFASVRPAVGRLLLNLNTTASAFFKSGPLSSFVSVSSSLGKRHQEETIIKGPKVEVDYSKCTPRIPNKIKTVFGYAQRGNNPSVTRFGSSKEVSFQFQPPNEASRSITVFDYYKKYRGFTLQKPDIPVINCGTASNSQYIPIELCSVLPGQQYRKVLPAAQNSKMISFAALPPQANAERIADLGLDLFGLSNSNTQARPTVPFGFGVQSKLLTVPARVLPQPMLLYGVKDSKAQNKPNPRVTPFAGSWKLEHQKFISTVSQDLRVYLVIIDPRPAELEKMHKQADRYLLDLQNMLHENGIVMKCRKSVIEMHQSFREENRARNAKLVSDNFKAYKKEGAQLLLTLTPSRDKWLYSCIKTTGDVLVGIHTINVTLPKLNSKTGDGTFTSNITLKVNVKTGGINHKVNNLMTGPVNASTMVVGVDVTHPAPGNAKTAPSVSAVVASIDDNFFQYPGSLRVQESRKEMVSGLKDMVVERLQLWRERNKRLPTQILVYRDGVSEGQYEDVLTVEVNQFKEAFAQIYSPVKQTWPKMTVVVVGKRHHVRFFPTSQRNAQGNKNNAPSGTVVDRHIVSKHLYEFYLQAHAALLGTARPAHYVVIKDDMGFTADQLVDFTYKLSFAFVRASKAISRCPPADYADRLCERARLYLYDQLVENSSSDDTDAQLLNLQDRITPHPDINKVTWYM